MIDFYHSCCNGVFVVNRDNGSKCTAIKVTTAVVSVTVMVVVLIETYVTSSIVVLIITCIPN